MSDDLNYQDLYNQAQQEIVNLQHTVRVLVAKLNEANGKKQELEVVEAEAKSSKKAN